jgi:hypothetical protein
LLKQASKWWLQLLGLLVLILSLQPGLLLHGLCRVFTAAMLVILMFFTASQPCVCWALSAD